ncbi:MAG: 6-phosphogluconolactonase, partial [Bacteroidota bacterium]
KTLSEKTRQDNTRFFRTLDEVPKYAITMGIGTIMDAREIILLANNARKADAVSAAVEGPLTAQCPASVIQMHRQAIIIVTKDAALKLMGTYPDTWKSAVRVLVVETSITTSLFL